MEDSPYLLGHLELHDLPRVHHDVRRPLLRDANEAVAVHLEKLVAGLRVGGEKLKMKKRTKKEYSLPLGTI